MQINDSPNKGGFEFSAPANSPAGRKYAEEDDADAADATWAPVAFLNYKSSSGCHSGGRVDWKTDVIFPGWKPLDVEGEAPLILKCIYFIPAAD